jgi:hypothetical protein
LQGISGGNAATIGTKHLTRQKLLRALVIESGVLTALVLFVAMLFVWEDNPTQFRLLLIKGPSMRPLLSGVNVILLQRADTAHRLDVILAVHRGMHRIVGLPGETIWIQGSHVCVATPSVPRHCPPEPYAHIVDAHWNEGPIHLGPGDYFAIADNRIKHWAGIVHGSEIRARFVMALYRGEQ